MKFKRGLSLLLAIIITIGVFGFSVLADGEAVIKTYITISKYGSILNDKNNVPVAEAEVELSGKEAYTLDDAFAAAHDLYYEGGAQEGYASEVGQYGLSVTKLWGDTSGNFAYQVNSGTVYVMGPDQEVSDGDYIDVYICESFYPATESYATFDKLTADTVTDEEIELNLTWAGYDDNWNMVFYPCEGAEITVDGQKTGLMTDENGNVTVSFSEAGEYIVSAVKTKTVEDKSVTAITAPVCCVTVSEKSNPSVSITVPADAEITLVPKGEGSGAKIEPVSFTENEDKGTVTYCYELEDGKEYSYTVSGAKYKTYKGKFENTAGFELEISAKMLEKPKKSSGGSSGGGATLVKKNNDKADETNAKEEVKEEKKTKKFSDVADDAWYAEAVQYATEKGLFEGVSDTEFDPDSNMTRAMFVTVLFRQDGSEEDSFEQLFDDVDKNAWYGKAVSWAAKKGFIKGVGNRKFAPDKNISFQEMILILYRYAQQSGIDMKEEAAEVPEGIEKSVSDWALEAMKWAYAHGLIKDGVAKQIPTEPAPRANIAAVLMNFCKCLLK